MKFLAYKSGGIEDKVLTVMARLVILLYLCHVSFIVAKNLLTQTEGNKQMVTLNIDKVEIDCEKYKKT